MLHPAFCIHFLKRWYYISKNPTQRNEVQGRSDLKTLKLCFSCFWRKRDGWSVSICRIPSAFEHRIADLFTHSVTQIWSNIFHLGVATLAFFFHFKGARTKACHGPTTKEVRYLTTIWHPQLRNQNKLNKLKKNNGSSVHFTSMIKATGGGEKISLGLWGF